jgi:hypothetical protein
MRLQALQAVSAAEGVESPVESKSTPTRTWHVIHARPSLFVITRPRSLSRPAALSVLPAPHPHNDWGRVVVGWGWGAGSGTRASVVELDWYEHGLARDACVTRGGRLDQLPQATPVRQLRVIAVEPGSHHRLSAVSFTTLHGSSQEFVGLCSLGPRMLPPPSRRRGVAVWRRVRFRWHAHGCRPHSIW